MEPEKKTTPKSSKIKKIQLPTWAVFCLCLLLFFVLIINAKAVNQWLSGLLMLLRPVLIGLVLSYLLNPMFRLLERKVFVRLRPQVLRRTVSLILTYLFALVVLCLLLLLILPQLVDSILHFIGNYDTYLSSAIYQINGVFRSINRFVAGLTGNETILNYLNESTVKEQITQFFSNLAPEGGYAELLSSLSVRSIGEAISGAFSIITDSFLGIFISIYLLSSKEKRAKQIMKLRRALCSDSVNAHITRTVKITNRAFGSFFEGKLLGALIVAILLYVSLSILNIPYALLISVYIGFLNIIPVLGILIGAIPAVVILLLSAPAKVIPFLIVVILIQQIDLNIISPKILGSNTGVSSLCILIAITSMGYLWGLIGMLIGVPLFALLLELLDEYTEAKLQKKGLPSGLANYYANDAIVNPTKNAHSMDARPILALEKRALIIQRKLELREPLSRREKMQAFLYRLAYKFHILSAMSDETLVRISAEQAAKQAYAEADRNWQQAKMTQTTSDADVSNVN